MHVDRYDVLTAPRKRKAKNQDAPSTFRQLKLGETKIVSQRNVYHAVLNFVIQSLQPFSVVEQPSFQDLLQDLQPNASLMSRTTLRRKIECFGFYFRLCLYIGLCREYHYYHLSSAQTSITPHSLILWN